MSRRDEPPAYERIAAQLRAQIKDRVLLPNQLLPAEAVLAAEFGVARKTIRQALDVLRQEGAIVTTHGRGSVIQSEYARRDMFMDRYRDEVRRVAAGLPAVIPAGNVAEVEVTRVPADEEIADALRVDQGELVLHRWLLHTWRGVPQTLSDTYYRLDLTAGTVVDLDRSGHEGGIGLLAAIGVRVDGLREAKVARPPDFAERKALRIVGEASVMAVTRWMFAGDRVVEFARDIVFPGDRAAFVDRIDLSGDWASATA